MLPLSLFFNKRPSTRYNNGMEVKVTLKVPEKYIIISGQAKLKFSLIFIDIHIGSATPFNMFKNSILTLVI